MEVTEHEAISAYDELTKALGPLQKRGLRVAVDDAGAGYATFQHILRLKPDMIKLDMAITRDIDQDPARRALATALIAFARDTGSVLVAEGVETDGELDALRSLGITVAQGYHLGRPGPLFVDPAAAPPRDGVTAASPFAGFPVLTTALAAFPLQALHRRDQSAFPEALSSWRR